MNYAPIYKIYQILIVVPLTGLWVLDTAALLPFHDNENNGRLGMISWKIFSAKIASAQTSTPSIVPEANSTNTVVTPVTPSPDSSTTRFDITGGKQSQDNTNLFHSFERFNLGENQIVNFISNPNIKNILTRVTGGDASVINGLIQVTGGNSNLLMMNSAGIIFGANARLDVPASFVVTTGSGIGFDSGWFNSIGENNYDILTGNPSAFSFPMTNPGVILNEGELTVEAGESVTLLGGTIINTGKISAPGGEITISTVLGENLVRISQEGRLLNLEIATEDRESSNDLPEELHSLNPLSIPELLTGNSEVMEMATGVRVNDNNEVVLTGSNQVIPTDLGTTIVSGSLDISLAENSELANTSRINIFGEKVGLFNAKLNASGIYGSGNIRIGGDSQGLGTVPRATRTYVDENTEIFATSFRDEGGNIVIWSDEETSFFGKIEAIGRIEEQSISLEQNSSKNLVEVSSQGNLIFDGTVNLGSPDVLGSLSFKAENINIVDANIEAADNPLKGETAAGSQISKSSIESISDSTNITFQASDNITVNNLSETQLSFAQTKGEISFVADSDENGLGSLTIHSENTINTQGAAVNISGTTINTGNINTEGGELNITSSQGFVMTNNLSTANSNMTVESNGGEINITAQGNITTGEIDASGDSRGGNITMNAATNIDTESINAEGTQSGGNIDTRAGNTLNLRGISTSSGSRETGNITITGDEINLLGGENSVSSNGKLILQPASENQNITLGGFENIQGTDGNLPLHLTTGDLATLANGFESVTIGKSENSGNITIASTENSNTNGVVFNDPTTIQAEKITGTGTITGVDNAQITINASSDISTGNISTSTGITITSIQGNVKTGDVTANTSDNSIGNIDITSSGSIETGKLTTTGTTAGGNINLQAGDRITIGRINSSATLGNAGEVQLNAENGIEVISIQAEGGNSGGNVEITTGDTLRITGTFLDKNQNIASISTAGEIVGGNIAISTGNTPFIVGDATINGSVGAITDGKLTISPDRSLTSSFELKEVENSQPQNSDSSETTTESENQENQPHSEESTPQNVTQLESTESSNYEGNQTSIVTETQAELVEKPKNIEESQTQIPSEVDNEEPSNTAQDIQIVSQNPESNSPILDNSEPTAAPTENIASSMSSSEEQIIPLVVENQNQNQTTLEFDQPNNSQLVVENVETNILVEDTNSSSITSVLEQTVAIENPVQGKSSQKPTPTIVVEENMTTTASEISRNDNYNQVSLTDSLWQIELNRGREFAGYLGKNITKKTATAANIRNTLSSVEKIGIRPAIIYVSAQPNNLELQLFLPNGKPIVRSSGQTRDEVIEVAKKFTNQIRTPSQLNSHNYLPNAQKLHQWLIAPIAEELANHNINTIIFSMDSGLRTIPIAALHDGQQFLVEKYSLGLIPSFTLTDTTYVGLNGSQVLAMGASEFPGNTEQTPLPAVPVELKSIVNNLWPGKSFLNQGFTLENLKQQSSKEKFKIIHLATHGEFHPGGADNSYIQFWDTKLRLNELRQLRLYNAQVELLVLSACTTAVGDEEAELGFAGLAVQAGVKSALASLWYVSDTGTLALMTEFYQSLSNRPIKAAALRQAQLAMLRGELHLQDGHILRNGNKHLPLPRELARGGRRDLSHPYYWAAFTMIGSPW
ncbi:MULTISPECIES: CHAT domain-containing protein [Okeania]|uniref:CHAT domain-containing protein n=1 Tax=Okeania hirsuta TaxID=1458930 RepID=A0A3N6P4E8_9CYAN|nr:MULTISPECIES: CHAT domain-containing protein [Okeania]NES88764.1 CHAT domain-containing protein [Okeania sp. SIO2B9]NET80223.1 CHAT domain-containing protein [Okeania sp. SIO1F9]RQH18236.1 CHAT domain-containing protein [Okeania hirsuta]RQH31850.1 CHAT domain-containing protein [Okeania hirsuta]